MEDVNLDFKLEESHEVRDAKKSLLKTEKALVKRQKYKYYFLAAFIFLATAFFIFWASSNKSQHVQNNHVKIVNLQDGNENGVGASWSESGYESSVGTAKKLRHKKKAKPKATKKKKKSSNKKKSPKSSVKKQKKKKSPVEEALQYQESMKKRQSKKSSSKSSKKKGKKKKHKRAGRHHWHVYYTNQTASLDQGFCGLKWAPYFDMREDFDWHTYVHEGDHLYRAEGLPHGVDHALEKMKTHYWQYTTDENKDVDIVIEGRSQKKPQGPNDARIAKRYTDYDGYVLSKVGKAGKAKVFDRIIDSDDYACKFRNLKSYNLEKKKQFKQWCSKNSNDRIWLFKPNYGSHGDGIHIVRKKERQNICKKKKGPEEVVVQEFLQNPALIQGYKFHVRFLVFFVAKPFVMYAAPRASYFRFSSTKYNTKRKSGYITNEGDCMLEFCLQFDSDFVGKTVSEKKWFKAVSRMSRISYLIIREYYGRKIRDGKVSPNRFNWVGFDFLLDEHFNPLFDEWNEQPQLRHHKYPEFQYRFKNFVDGMFSVVNGYAKHLPQESIDGISRKYQFMKVAVVDDSDPVNVN